MRAFLAAILLAAVIAFAPIASKPAKAAEPGIDLRFPAGHFLDHRPFAKPAGKAVQRSSRKVARKGRAHVAAAPNSRRERSASIGRSVSLAGVTPILVAKAQEIMAACGSVVTSARHARGYRSNHPIGRAVDMQGNPACIRSHLMGWKGGMSTDYWTAPGGPHYHISYNPGGQEWGIRFAHRNPFFTRRYAKRHKRYAAAR